MNKLRITLSACALCASIAVWGCKDSDVSPKIVQVGPRVTLSMPGDAKIIGKRQSPPMLSYESTTHRVLLNVGETDGNGSRWWASTKDSNACQQYTSKTGVNWEWRLNRSSTGEGMTAYAVRNNDVVLIFAGGRWDSQHGKSIGPWNEQDAMKVMDSISISDSPETTTKPDERER